MGKPRRWQKFSRKKKKTLKIILKLTRVHRYHVTPGDSATLRIVAIALLQLRHVSFVPAAPILVHLESQIHFGMIVDSDNNNIMVCKPTFPPQLIPMILFLMYRNRRL